MFIETKSFTVFINVTANEEKNECINFVVEVTSYNLARIRNVYEECNGISCDYVYCNESVSGHKTNDVLPDNAIILSGSILCKLKKLISIVSHKNIIL